MANDLLQETNKLFGLGASVINQGGKYFTIKC